MPRNVSPRGMTKENYSVLFAPKPNDTTVTGGRINFDASSAELGKQQLRQLRSMADQLAGKRQKFEIRGHACRRPLPRRLALPRPLGPGLCPLPGGGKFLVSQKIDPERIRLSVSGTNEPLPVAGDPLKIQQNSRVEIRMLNEWLAAPQARRRPAWRSRFRTKRKITFLYRLVGMSAWRQTYRPDAARRDGMPPKCGSCFSFGPEF